MAALLNGAEEADGGSDEGGQSMRLVAGDAEEWPRQGGSWAAGVGGA